MVLEHDSYREYLKDLLSERLSRNPQYSLRAMARQIKLDPAAFSAMLSAKRNLPLDKAYVVAQSLELSPVEQEYFCTLVQYENHTHPGLRKLMKRHLLRLRDSKSEPGFDLSTDIFRTISQWYHIAIMQLFDGDSPVDADTASRRLGISIHEARDALDRLERIQLVHKENDGTYQRLHGRVKVESQAPDEALRIYHRALLTKATESLTNQTNEEKFIGSETFAFSTEQLEKAKEIIEECFEKLLGLAAQSKNRNEVYSAGIQLFRLTKRKEKQ